MNDDTIVARAESILLGRLIKARLPIEQTAEDLEYLFKIMLMGEKREVFAVAFLDISGHLIDVKKLFEGTVCEVQVIYRELIKSCLEHNCTSVVIAHNHPHGNANPSNADIKLTRSVEEALDWIDVMVVDHILVAHNETVSFVKEGYWKAKE